MAVEGDRGFHRVGDGSRQERGYLAGRWGLARMERDARAEVDLGRLEAVDDHREGVVECDRAVGVPDAVRRLAALAYLVDVEGGRLDRQPTPLGDGREGLGR